MTQNKKPLHIAYDDAYLGWVLGTEKVQHPSNPVRASIATRALIELYPNLTMLDPTPDVRDAIQLMNTHDVEYIKRVLNGGISDEWAGERQDLGMTALTMFAGTVRCADAIVNGSAKVAFNPQGAKHHAQYEYSMGFCVFNDFAWAAQKFARLGWNVLYIDFDAHHGDGVENLTRDNPKIVTASIHDGTIFPGTGRDGHAPEIGVYNWALEAYAGGTELMSAMHEIKSIADEFKPDIVLLAAGADGHTSDPLSTLDYRMEDYTAAALVVADIVNTHTDGKILVGGAGGYKPFDITPQIWTEVVKTIVDNT